MQSLNKKVVILGENKIKFLKGQMNRLPENHSFSSNFVDKVELECAIFPHIDYNDRYLEKYIMDSDLVIICLPKEKEKFYILWRYIIPRISPYYKSTIKDLKEKDVVDFRETFMGVQQKEIFSKGEKEEKGEMGKGGKNGEEGKKEKIVIFLYGEDEEAPSYVDDLNYIYPHKLTYVEKDKERFMDELALFIEENNFS